MGRDRANLDDDVAKVEAALETAGLVDLTPTEGPTGVFSRLHDEALRGFQRAKGLTVDGVVNPDGPTIRTLQRYKPAARHSAPVSSDAPTTNLLTGVIPPPEAGRSLAELFARTTDETPIPVPRPKPEVPPERERPPQPDEGMEEPQDRDTPPIWEEKRPKNEEIRPECRDLQAETRDALQEVFRIRSELSRLRASLEYFEKLLRQAEGRPLIDIEGREGYHAPFVPPMPRGRSFDPRVYGLELGTAIGQWFNERYRLTLRDDTQQENDTNYYDAIMEQIRREIDSLEGEEVRALRWYDHVAERFRACQGEGG